ncbi:MAG: hypothetical protein NVSMB46_00980 [Candidatus Saccharimonadales bacterium]
MCVFNKMNITKLRQTGDTIVEVLIAMAVISFALGATYVTANRSLQSTQQAQERSQATKIAESQAELLNTISVLKPGQPGYIDIYQNSYCISGTYPNFSANTIPPAGPTGSLALDSLNEYGPASCTFSNGSVAGLFNVSILYTPGSSPKNGTFIIQVRWFRLGGFKDELNIFYRVT